MKLVSFEKEEGKVRAGLLIDNSIYDLHKCGKVCKIDVPKHLLELLNKEDGLQRAHSIEQHIKSGIDCKRIEADSVRLLSPIPRPPSCRDAYAFRQHVETARKNRGAEMIPEFDQFPVFYFTNHNAIVGEGDVILEKDHFERLDFELECAIVIGKGGKNISAAKADEHIAGFTIMNDLSARQLQMEEMKLSLGPAKGKDFATVLGPWLVTPDELEQYKIDTPSGATYDLVMTAQHNGREISRGNLKDMNWTFAQIIERASYGVELFAGDVIGSGTVGTGCYLELNGTKAREAEAAGQSYTSVWLQDGDEISLSITGLGTLTNRVRKGPGDYSILELKHK
ncbi:MAG: fumarylacetoacetate hydrolase family protein [Candidatus Zixiibacteriota bacterium]